MGKTTKLQLKGTIEWAKVFKENRDMTGWNNAYAECDGACTVDMLLDDENLAILKASGSSKELDNAKRQTDKGYRVKFVRKFSNIAFPSNGGAPQVGREDGSLWDISEYGLIGNGSIGIVYLTVFENASGNDGTRLEGLQVLDHVEYDSGGDFGGPTFKDYSTPAPTTDDDDDLPF